MGWTKSTSGAKGFGKGLNTGSSKARKAPEAIFKRQEFSWKPQGLDTPKADDDIPDEQGQDAILTRQAPPWTDRQSQGETPESSAWETTLPGRHSDEASTAKQPATSCSYEEADSDDS